jgi:UDP-N-acetylmuramoyl-tripeptide--D-alanyl-D-alanine ligase
MLELGDGAAAAHAGVGTYAAQAGVDVLVSVGAAASAMTEGFSAVGTGGVTVPTAGREEAAEWLRHNVSAADVVLVKASRGAALEVIAEDLAHDRTQEGRRTR